jgi:HTH-type transcriptional regulator/antitoxin HigA
MKIETKQAYYAAMAEIEALFQKGFSNLSHEEEERLDLLSTAVEAWESQEYPMPMKPNFREIMAYLMKTKNLNQTGLAKELHVSKGYINGLLHGTKSPNIDLLRSIHSKYQIDGNLLLESLA